MTTRARAATAGPKASRPWFPRDYGVSTATKGLLPWSHVVERMTKALHYWIATTCPDGTPHATPVDGLWLDDRLYFGGSPRTRRQRNLAANPSVCVHLESASDVVILRGDARPERPDAALAKRLAESSVRKYGYGQTPEQYEKTDVHVFRPRVAFAWTDLPKNATRWEFP
ncbi:MAG TPA: pyridoxamine 5'-phosphate oxidase family protein [Vicinamibacterales bacterium]|nr:pyridoxamine 5'-phosphate oxidase family protein [Vicinamibacterales bacterium]